MIAKGLAILALVIVALMFCHTIITKQPPKPQEYDQFGDYFFNQ